LGNPLRVLFIEDSARDRELQLRLLRQADYAVDSERVDTPDVLKQALEKSWDLIISDYCMRRFPGTDAFRLIRQLGLETPFIFVSGTIAGVGIDRDALDQIFEPFFTTKQEGNGNGLGLATVYGIAKQHNGFIEVDSVKGSGSTFRIHLPAAEGADPAPRKAPRFQLPKGTETILIAEDDDDVRETMRLILENLGYKVFAAGNGSEAVELFVRVKSSVDLVLLDVIMPVLNGPEAAARMSAIKPHLAFIFMTGYGIDSKLRELRTIEKAAILQKPFDAWQLANKLREVLDRKET